MSNSKQIESTHFHNFKIMKIEKDILHVINSKGEHLTIPFIENPMANEDISESYTIDDVWTTSRPRPSATCASSPSRA